MLQATYYSQNYARIIAASLALAIVHVWTLRGHNYIYMQSVSRSLIASRLVLLQCIVLSTVYVQCGLHGGVCVLFMHPLYTHLYSCHWRRLPPTTPPPCAGGLRPRLALSLATSTTCMGKLHTSNTPHTPHFFHAPHSSHPSLLSRSTLLTPSLLTLHTSNTPHTLTPF